MCHPTFAQALLCFLDQLEDEDVQTRVAGCLALGCIKVIPCKPPYHLHSRAVNFLVTLRMPQCFVP